jgi:hypothetical protein
VPGFAQEVVQRSGAVMLRNEVGDLCRQTDLFRELCAVGYVTRDDLRALVRTQSIVRVVALLVLDEVLGAASLPMS